MNEQKTILDLTKTLDPAELWPNPEACPDWPVFRDENSRRMNPSFSRRDAEQRLSALDHTLSRGQPVHTPSAAEHSAAYARFFTEGTPASWQYQQLGLAFGPRDRTVETQAMAIVEAAHIRGWLRKLDAAAESEAKRKKEADEARLRGKAESWPAQQKAMLAELQPLLEGENRHLQRLDDERAFNRARDLRGMLTACEREAIQAARALGVAVAGRDSRS